VDDQGETKHTKVTDYKPSLFTKTEEDGDAVSIFGYPLKQIEFENIKAAKNFYEQYKDVDGMTIEGNYKFANQFTIELCEGKTPDYDPQKIRGCILDIEVSAPEFPKPEQALYPIDAVTFYDTIANKFTAFGLGEYHRSKDNTKVNELNLDVDYTQCSSENELLLSIVNFISNGSFHFTSGWNSESFDMPYIVNRITNMMGEKVAKRLSPYGMINWTTVQSDYFSFQKVDIVGLPHLDYMNLYKKHTFVPRESYSLNFIAGAELGDEKLSYEEEGSLANLSKVNFQKYISYNIIDVDIIRRLDEELGLFDITQTLAYLTISNYEDTLGTVRLWEQLIAKELYARQIVPLCSPVSNTYRPYPGGYVSEPQVGRHEWVSSFDLNSLYPMLEVQINISPETFIPRHDLPSELAELQDQLRIRDIDCYYQQVMNLVDKEVDLSVLKKHNVSMSAAGQFYRRDIKGIIPTIKDEIYSSRKQFKKKMLQAQAKLDQLKGMEDTDEYHYWKREEAKNNNIQMAFKILINSGYGALANKHFTYFRIENAESITSTGQLVNRWTSERVNKLLNELATNKNYKNYVINNDTDSVAGDSVIYVNGDPITIEEYFNTQRDFIVYDTFNEHYVASVSGDTSYGSDDAFSLVKRPVKYVMKHKTQKRMYRVTVNGKSVTVTADHGLMVNRGGELVKVRPGDVRVSDKLISLTCESDTEIGSITQHDDYQIEDLGIVEDYVYDIEVEDVHNFIANDILVHNSAYFELSDIASILCPDEEDPYAVTDKLDEFLKQVISPSIQSQTEELCDYLNNYENKMVWEREVISTSSINVAKKRYAMLVTDSEGVRFTTPKLKIIGLDSKRSSTPAWAKKGLEICYRLALEDKKDEMHQFIETFEKEFYTLPISDIAIPRSVSSIEKYMDGHGGYIKGTQKHVKAAILHNTIVEQKELKHIDKLKSGNKFKFIELKKPNPYNGDVIGFLSYLPKEFEIEKYVDKQVTFESGFLKPLSNFLTAINWSTEEKIDLFDF
jgi:DNA polymerase elongation subunit (family B)